MNKFYIIFYFILNSLAWGQTQVIPSLEASAGNLTTPGAVPYISAPGVLNQDASNLFWDATNHRLGIGTNAPGFLLSVRANDSSVTTPNITLDQAGVGDASFQWRLPSVIAYGMGIDNSDSAKLKISNTTADSNLATNPIITITSTGSTGIGPNNASPTGTLHVYNATASTGVTTLTVKAGAGQSSTNLQEWQNNAGSVIAWLDSTGSLNTLTAAFFAGGGYRVANNATVTFSNGTNFTNTSLSRISDGVVGVGTGAAGSVAGTLQAKSVAIISPVVPATAADACTAGAISWDASYIYVCTASGAWKRSAIATW